MPPLPPDGARRRLAVAQVAILGTVRADGRAHVVPIVWVRADGRARVVESGPERDVAIRLLRAKYPGYATWSTPFGAATIVEIENVSSWTM